MTVEDPYGGRAESSIMITACDADEIGIFSESTYYNVVPDVNSFTGIIVKGRAICDSFRIDSVVKREGEFSRKISMSVASRNESCGWFVQHGVEGTSNAFTRDLTKFIGGYLKFSVKSSVDLLVGIRSGNVLSGQEDSKVLLSDYSNFSPDDNWHDISIPLKDFAGSPPKADFTEIKVLFEILSEQRSGGTGGSSESVWVDNVRWTRGGH